MGVAVRGAGVDGGQLDDRGDLRGGQVVADLDGALELLELATDLGDHEVAGDEAQLAVAGVDVPGAGGKLGDARHGWCAPQWVGRGPIPRCPPPQRSRGGLYFNNPPRWDTGAVTSAPGTPTRWLSDREQAAWRAYLRGSRRLEAALDRDLQEHGLQLTEYEIISMLSESPGHRLRMSCLADLVVQSRSRLTHTAARLEKRGWVGRESCLDDRRGVELVLTDDGFEAIRTMAAVHVESVRRHLVDVVPAEMFQAVGEAMSRVGEASTDDGATGVVAPRGTRRGARPAPRLSPAGAPHGRAGPLATMGPWTPARPRPTPLTHPPPRRSCSARWRSRRAG